MIVTRCNECEADIVGHTGLEAQEVNTDHYKTCSLYPIVRKLRHTAEERRVAAEKRLAGKMICGHCFEELIIEGALRSKKQHSTYAANFHCNGRKVPPGEIPHHELLVPPTQEQIDAAIASVVAGIRGNIPIHQAREAR